MMFVWASLLINNIPLFPTVLVRDFPLLKSKETSMCANIIYVKSNDYRMTQGHIDDCYNTSMELKQKMSRNGHYQYAAHIM